jgi:hypothetical protein
MVEEVVGIDVIVVGMRTAVGIEAEITDLATSASNHKDGRVLAPFFALRSALRRSSCLGV